MKKFLAVLLAMAMVLALVACGNTASQPTATPEPVDLAAFAEKYVSEQLMPPLLDTNEDMGKQILDTSYAGLSDLDLEQCLPYVSMMSINNTEMVLVQTKNADDVAKVKEIFQARIDNMLNGGTFYPETIEIWQNNAEIVEKGNYVALVVSTDKDAIVPNCSGQPPVAPSQFEHLAEI